MMNDINHQSLRRLKDEDGTALTEFVICLPIFIVLFIGINVLYTTNHEGAARAHRR